MNNDDRRYIDTMLHAMAFKIYSQYDLYIEDKELGKKKVEEFETYVYEQARNIFSMYRDTSMFGRMILASEAQERMHEYRDELIEEMLQEVEDPEELKAQDFFDKLLK